MPRALVDTSFVSEGSWSGASAGRMVLPCDGET
jgi:hypothetical protein